MPAPDRLRREEAAACGDATSHTEPGASADRRNHRALCNRRAGKCQHGDLPLPARDHLDRFKNRAYHTRLQENERRKMRSVVGGWPARRNLFKTLGPHTVSWRPSRSACVGLSSGSHPAPQISISTTTSLSRQKSLRRKKRSTTSTFKTRKLPSGKDTASSTRTRAEPSFILTPATTGATTCSISTITISTWCPRAGTRVPVAPTGCGAAMNMGDSPQVTWAHPVT
jgi:hypothetical protein